MSGPPSLGSALTRLPTILRTIVRLRPGQVGAQLHHALFGLPSPMRLAGPPPRLAVARPTAGFLDPPAHVRSRGGGRIELLSIPFDLAAPVDWNTTDRGPLFAYHLHQHEFLRLPAFSPEERAAILEDWIGNHRVGIGWDPHPISLRLICWTKLLLSPGLLPDSSGLREAILSSMADQAETLSRGLETRLQANHLLSNLIGVVVAGIVLEGSASEAWRERSIALVRELDRQIRPDGGHEERSPMYHALLLESLLDLQALCLALPERVPRGLSEVLREKTVAMLRALEMLTHPDGRIALFADSALGIASEPSALRAYAGRLGLPSDPIEVRSDCLPQMGYVRLSASPFDLIASVSGPSPPHQPGHAHCDALAFELSVDGTRLVTDTGVFEYRPGARRDHARATASHATLQFDRREQAEIWAAHRVGGRPTVALTAWDAAGSAEATCRGWSRNAPLHRRLFAVGADGVSIADRIEGSFSEIRSCLPIDPAWTVTLEGGRASARCGSTDRPGTGVEIELPAAFEWSLERGPYYPTFGREVERFILTGRASRVEGEAVIRFRKQ